MTPAAAGARAARAVATVALAPVAVFVVVAVAVAAVVNLVAGFVVGVLAAAGAAVALHRYLLARSATIALGHLGGRPADPVEHARLLNLVEGLCITQGVPEPALRVLDDDGVNAAVVGTDPRASTLLATRGLLATLDRIALEAVLARLVAQIRSGRAASATRGVVTAGIPAAAAESGGLGFLGASAARWFATEREAHGIVHDDIAGVSATRYPPGLVTALEAMAANGTSVGAASRVTAHLFVADPVPAAAEGDRTGRFDLFPPIRERVAVLREL